MSSPPDHTLDFNALVSLITEAVLGRLQGVTPRGGAAGGGAAPAAPVVEARRIAWLLAAPCGHLEVLTRQVSTLARLGHAQVVVACADVVDGLRSTPGWPGEGPGLSLQGVEGRGVSALLALLRHQDVIYVGALGWRQAAALAELDDRDTFGQLLLGALAAGTPVCVLADRGLSGLQGLAPGTTAVVAPALQQRAARLWRALEGLGVRALGVAELRRPLAALEAADSAQGRAFGGLLTERDVQEAAAAGVRELRLARATVITPLARDRARELDVRIEQV